MSLRDAIRDNEQKLCKAKGCGRHRDSWSAHCGMHNTRLCSYGSVEGRRIKPREYQMERLKVQHLLEVNSQHPGILQAQEFFSQWLEQAFVGKVLARKHLLRLHDEGIKPVELLEEIASVYLYSFLYPWALPEGLPLDYAVAIAVLAKSARRCGYTSIKDLKFTIRRQVGVYIRERIGRLLFNIVSTIRKQEEQEALQSKVQSEPFK